MKVPIRLPFSFDRYEHQKLHELHKGHEAMHMEMVLILLVTMIVAQVLLIQWRQRHVKSYQVVSLFGMWIIPLLFSIRNLFWRFVFTWLLFSCITGLIVFKSLQRPVHPATPRSDNPAYPSHLMMPWRYTDGLNCPACSATSFLIQKQHFLDHVGLKDGCPQKLSSEGKQFCVHAITSGKLETATQITNKLRDNIGLEVSIKTFRCALYEAALCAAYKEELSKLSPANIKARLDPDRLEFT
ncbi:unnamed protein product [Darwinula stevensoni]|uniref:Uncharacterized protein n=1 Tax=Darwinula stevensoni TaxID=69355 RepID=A0A7R9A1L0_9CRUS|nr:unnamed protein product [Darwinula stevensoni]CAG0887945.1 unnamed protein product [Darwinula stevensoni]